MNEHDARVSEDDAGDSPRQGSPITCAPNGMQQLAVYRGHADITAEGLLWGRIDADFEGTVQEIGSGIPSGLDPFGGKTPPEAAYMRVTAPTGESWTVVARSLDTFGVQLRAAVRFVVQRLSGSFYEPLRIRVQMYEKHALRFAYTANADPPEGFSVEPGAELCTQTSRCGTWTSYKLRVRGPCSQIAEIEPFGRGTVCDHEVRPGRYVLDLRTGTCDDWFMRGMEMILIPARGPDTDAGI